MDFGSIRPPSFGGKKPTNPEEIFRLLPRGRDAINDLWRGQTDVLREWDAHRKNPDILISLNTGAGKTIVGLLIAQSLIHEGIENVVIACTTIDLVRQTSREATRLGLKHTLRFKQKFTNDLFQSGQAFCITTYQAVFQPFSVFKNEHEIGALILDDAHTAEPRLREAFTVSIKRKDENAVLFDELRGLFLPTLREIGRHQTFDDIVSGIQNGTILVPPNRVFDLKEQVAGLFKKHKFPTKIGDRFSWQYIKDQLGFCVYIFSKGQLEIAPPFLPVGYLSHFSRSDIRRIYLSATLNYQSDFARSFGRLPLEIGAPNNDAGEGERLVLLSRYLKVENFSPSLVKSILAKHKLLVSVPTYEQAKNWTAFGSPPDPQNDDFSALLDQFRHAAKGIFILVFRLDGIDLPDDACRLMLIDRLPTGASLFERFQWESLGMRNNHASRLANRITQLFGRINRGRRDYGVFLISGRDANLWLSNERNLALLPSLLRRQIILGASVQDQMKIDNDEKVLEVTEKVLNRDEDWVRFYTDSINADVTEEAKVRAKEIQGTLVKAGLAEAACALALWEHDISRARAALSDVIEDVNRADSKIGGWYNLWRGVFFEMEGDKGSAATEYHRARSKLGPQSALPRTEEIFGEKKSLVPASRLTAKMSSLLTIGSDEAFAKELRDFEAEMAPLSQDGATPRQCEEAVRVIGEMLGFEATRPDNEGQGGPDVLWRDASAKLLISLELKTDKKDDGHYNAEDIAKAHNYIQWVKDMYGAEKHLGLIFVGPPGGPTGRANPTEMMHVCQPEDVLALGKLIVDGLRDIRRATPLNRPNKSQVFEGTHKLSTPGIFERLAKYRLLDKKPA